MVGRIADEARREGAIVHAEQLQERARSYEEGVELLSRLIAHANEAEFTNRDAQDEARARIGVGSNHAEVRKKRRAAAPGQLGAV